MKKSKLSLGKTGEILAAEFYIKLGFFILKRNYRHGRAEMDLIVQNKSELLVFVEVKTRTNKDFGYPEIFVSKKQQHRLIELANHFINENNWNGKIRFDIISINFGINNTPILEHFEDAFY